MQQSIRNKKQLRMYNTLKALQDLPKTTVTQEGDLQVIWIWHEQQFVPGFKLVWCDRSEKYRVYIHVADPKNEKRNAGYSICALRSILAVAGFMMLYSFLHRNRANNKTEAYATSD